MNLEAFCKTEGRFGIINSEEAGVIDGINDALLWGAMDYLRKEGFTWVEVPIMTKITGACENVDTLYAVDHFGQEAYLAQTGQLYLEAKIPLHNKLWTIITSSRAEDQADERHLNQFQLIELEHAGRLGDVLGHIEGTVKAMMRSALRERGNDLEELGRYEEMVGWVEEKFGCISYREAVDVLDGSAHAIRFGDDFSSEHEQYLVQEMGRKPLFITHFPKAIKFFNMRENRNDPQIVNSADLVMPYSGESAGAAEREDDHDRLVTRLKESPMFRVLQTRGKTLDDFADYLEMVKKNPVLHSGCGIGFNRISQSVLGSKDIQTSTNYPIQCNVLY